MLADLSCSPVRQPLSGSRYGNYAPLPGRPPQFDRLSTTRTEVANEVTPIDDIVAPPETAGMNRSATIAAGIGSISFGLLTPTALFVGGPMGGNYAAADAASYISSGHLVLAVAMALCGLLGVAGLICLGAYLRQQAELEDSASIWPPTVWGLILGAAICFAVSWGIFVSQPVGNNEPAWTSRSRRRSLTRSESPALKSSSSQPPRCLASR
jgi:hypothetical protein